MKSYDYLEDRLAAALHEAQYGPFIDETTHGAIVDCDCHGVASRLIDLGYIKLDDDDLVIGSDKLAHIERIEKQRMEALHYFLYAFEDYMLNSSPTNFKELRKCYNDLYPICKDDDCPCPWKDEAWKVLDFPNWVLPKK